MTEKIIPATNGGFNEGGGLRLSVDAFTYPGWEEHAKKVEHTFTHTGNIPISHTVHYAAKQMIRGMERFQQIHDGTLIHATIQKLRIAQLTYPHHDRDIQEVMECFLRMQDTLAKTIVNNIVKKQKLHNADPSNNVLAIFGPASSISNYPSDLFTYPMWESHARLIKDTASNKYNDIDMSFGPSREELTRKMLNGMKRMQRVYDKRVKNRGISILFSNRGIFTYPNWERDKEEALIMFLKFDDREAIDFLRVMKLKQDKHQGDRSHEVLSAIDTSTFNYKGWEEHAKAAEMALTDPFKINLNEDRTTTAKRLLQGMRRLNSVLSGESHHQGISELYKTAFSYPKWERDLEEATNHYVRFQDTFAKEVYDVMLKKQQIHDGDRSEDIIVTLDNMKSTHSTLTSFQGSVSSSSPRDVMQIDGLSEIEKRDRKATESARIIRRRIENQRGVKIKSREQGPRPDQLGKDKLSSARMNMRAIENKMGKNFKRLRRQDDEMSEALSADSQPLEELLQEDMQFCTSSKCLEECKLCAAHKMSNGAEAGCLCQQIANFDVESTKLLRSLSSRKLKDELKRNSPVKS